MLRKIPKRYQGHSARSLPYLVLPPFLGQRTPRRGIVERGRGLLHFSISGSGRFAKVPHGPRPALWQRFWRAVGTPAGNMGE